MSSSSALAHLRRNAVGYLALFVALGGTSYAAITLPSNSIGRAQLKNNAVASKEVKDRSLTSKDLKKGTVPRGPQGPQGPQGGQGPGGIQGPPGPFPSTLPSGRTLTGFVAEAGRKIGTSNTPVFSVSFAYPLAVNPTLNLLDLGDPATAACPGSPDDPRAIAGNFCLYLARNDGGLPVAIIAPAGSNGGRLGIRIGVIPGNDVDYEVEGSWAVTAP